MEMTTKKDWSEFRNTGLLVFINQFLHIFGWAIALEYEDGIVKDVYPVRTKFRGFSEENVSNAYIKLSKYMLDNAKELNDEI